MAMPSGMTAMNQLSNHDHSRFLTRTGRTVGRANSLGPEAAERSVDKAVLREAVVIQMTWVGAPTLYYGDEAGLCGFTDPDNRRTYPWGREDEQLIQFHRDVIRMHRQNREFRTGSLKRLYADYNFLVYGRFDRTQHSVVLINNNDHAVTKNVSVWELGIPQNACLRRLIYTHDEGYDTDPISYEVTGGKLQVTMSKTSAMVLQYAEEGEPQMEKQQVQEDFWQRR